MKKLTGLLLLLCVCLGFTACSTRSTNTNFQNDSTPKVYIENKGSDTIVNLALAWAEAYQKLHPSVSISITGGGTGTGIAALINNTTDIANASRQIKEEEILNAKNNGVNPYEIVIARDAIAIIINQNNPVNHLTLQQISDIYSGKINNWKEVGGEDRPIVRLSRESNSGTHVYFLETVLRMGDKNSKLLFDTHTLLLPSSEGITTEVRDNQNAIGYDGLGYVTPDVKVVEIGVSDEGPFIYPSAETVNQAIYPISRDLYAYTNGEPTGALKDYLDWILSSEAQQIVLETGFVPISTTD
ncbi:MAG: phosphate ABC transporter substrate-binding protein [Anaerolineaceae bacterium]|jgi:phosphate transport system substrate-binding protein